MIDLWAAPYNLRPDGSDCAPSIRSALLTGEPLTLEGCDPGEYACSAAAPGYPAVGLLSGSVVIGASGRVLTDRVGPRSVGVLGVRATTGTGSRLGIRLVGVEARHRNAAGSTEDHKDTFFFKSDAPSTAMIGVEMINCQSHESGDDGAYFGDGTFGIVRGWRRRKAGRYGLCIAGIAGEGRWFIVENLRDDALLDDSTQIVHVEIAGGGHLAGFEGRDWDAFGSVSMNRTINAVLERIHLRGGESPTGPRGGGLLITNSPGMTVTGLLVDWTRPPPQPDDDLSGEAAISIRGDCSGLVVRGGLIVQRHVDPPNSDRSAAIVVNQNNPSTGIELHRLTVWHPAGTLALSAPSGAVAVADLDDRVLP
jgi:hypothetical protein